MSRRRRADNEQSSPATDMLACGLGAAMILTLLFIGRTGDTEQKEEGLVLVELKTFSRFRYADKVDAYATLPKRDGTCVALVRRGEILVQGCSGDEGKPCQPLPPGVNGVCSDNGYSLTMVATESMAREVSILFSWPPPADAERADAETECKYAKLPKSDPLRPVLHSLITPHVEYSITELGGFRRTILDASWTIPGHPEDPSPEFEAAAEPVRELLIPGATTQEEACDMVLATGGVVLTPARARGEEVDLLISKR